MKNSLEGGKEEPKCCFGLFLFVGVRKLSLPCRGRGLPSRHPSCGCRTVNRTSTGDGCVFLLEPRHLPLKAHTKQNKVAYRWASERLLQTETARDAAQRISHYDAPVTDSKMTSQLSSKDNEFIFANFTCRISAGTRSATRSPDSRSRRRHSYSR